MTSNGETAKCRLLRTQSFNSLSVTTGCDWTPNPSPSHQPLQKSELRRCQATIPKKPGYYIGHGAVLCSTAVKPCDGAHSRYSTADFVFFLLCFHPFPVLLKKSRRNIFGVTTRPTAQR